jgi:hypothetical protein
MQYINLFGSEVSIVDDEFYEVLSEYKWYFTGGYASRNSLLIDGKHTTIKMHKTVIELSGIIIPPGMQIDHISRDKLDNRKNNLRVATHSQNQHNRTSYKTNKSGYKGVSWDKRSNNWLAYVRVNGCHKYIGHFDNVIEAAHAYDTGAKKFHKEFAVLNFPTGESHESR